MKSCQLYKKSLYFLVVLDSSTFCSCLVVAGLGGVCLLKCGVCKIILSLDSYETRGKYQLRIVKW